MSLDKTRELTDKQMSETSITDVNEAIEELQEYKLELQKKAEKRHKNWMLHFAKDADLLRNNVASLRAAVQNNDSKRVREMVEWLKDPTVEYYSDDEKKERPASFVLSKAGWDCIEE